MLRHRSRLLPAAGSRPLCLTCAVFAARFASPSGVMHSGRPIPFTEGEVRVVLVNYGDEPFRIESSDRIAQLLVQRVERAARSAVPSIDDTDRG